MMNFSWLQVRLVLTGCSLLLQPVLADWTTITYDDFEDGWGSFTEVEGAPDAERVTNSIHCFEDGNCLRIRDNSGELSSVFQENAYDVTPYEELRISFYYRGNGMESNEAFVVEYLDDTLEWTVLKQYTVDVDFPDNQDRQDTLSIDLASLPGLTHTKIRFRNDASDNSDRVFIDNVLVEGLLSTSPTTSPSPTPMVVTADDICPRNRRYPPEKFRINPYEDTNSQDDVDDDLNEVSYIAYSSQTDSNGNPYVYMASDKEQSSLKVVSFADNNAGSHFNGAGTVLATYTLFTDEPLNDDWEDISLGPCTHENNAHYTTDQVCIYVANTGNNPRFGKTQRRTLEIYKFVEPTIHPVDGPQNQLIDFATIRFSYGDGFDQEEDKYYDSEALMVDWIGLDGDANENPGDVYITTKSGCSGGVGKISIVEHSMLAPGDATLEVYEMPRVVDDPPPQGSITCGNGPFRAWTGSDMRRDGRLMILIREGPPASVYFFPRLPNQSVAQALGMTPCDYIASTSFGLDNEKKFEGVAFVDPTGLRFADISECEDSCEPTLSQYELEYMDSNFPSVEEPIDNWEEITYDTFESQVWGNFVSGGDRAELSNAVNDDECDGNCACEGQWAAELQEGRGERSSIVHGSSYPCDQFDYLRITFQFKFRGYDHLDTLFLEISLDGGTTFFIVGDWARDVAEPPTYLDDPLTTAICYDGKVVLQPSQFRVTSFGDDVKLRFRNSANAANDRVYIDSIRFEGYAEPSSAPTQGPTSATTSPTASPTGSTMTPKTGISSGDPHFKTFSGAKFDYHGECDLVLVNNPSFENGLGLRVHIRTTRVKYFSFIEKVAVQIGSDVLEFDNDVDNFLINREKVKPNRKHHKTMLGDFFVRRDKGAISIYLHKHDTSTHKRGAAKIDLHHRKNGFPAVFVDAGNTTVLAGSLGLLGDWPAGAKLARDGRREFLGINGPEDDATAFALEWQVQDDEPMIFKESRYPQFPNQCSAPAEKPASRLGGSLVTKEAEEACAHWLYDKEDCIFDVIATGDIFTAEEGHIVHVE